MTSLFPDFLRALVSIVMNIVLMVTLLQPKYSRKVTNLVMFAFLVCDFLIAVFCYIHKDLTLLSKLDVVIFIVTCIAMKPLFQDSFMQWLFSFITIQNIGAAVIVLSFLGSRPLPGSIYANTLLRLIMFFSISIFLRYSIRPLYRQIVSYWNMYFYMAATICAAFLYYFIGSRNIVVTLTEEAVPLVLLILVATASYASIFHSMKTLSREHKLQEENLKMQNGQELLRLSVLSMQQQLAVIDEAARNMSITNHDIRHFNNTLIELLRRGEVVKATALLEQQVLKHPEVPRRYCENRTVNAAISHYAGLLELADIPCNIKADLPEEIPVDSLELSIALSNLLENAINALEKLPSDITPRLYCTILYREQLILEVENTCDREIPIDEKGYPIAHKTGHGIGTKSVLAFAERYNAEVIYRVCNNCFNVRLVL